MCTKASRELAACLVVFIFLSANILLAAAEAAHPETTPEAQVSASGNAKKKKKVFSI